MNPFSVLRAAWQDLTSGRVVSGGSTLTMQVARLLDPHPRTLVAKIRQLWRAMQLEWHLSKRDILTLYLNRAPFGGTLQGIGAASADLPRQTTFAAQLFRSGAARRIAAGAKPVAS